MQTSFSLLPERIIEKIVYVQAPPPPIPGTSNIPPPSLMSKAGGPPPPPAPPASKKGDQKEPPKKKSKMPKEQPKTIDITEIIEKAKKRQMLT